MRDVLLVLHIVGVCVWLGANVVLAFVGTRTVAAGVETQAWWAEVQGAMARVLYNIAGVLVLATGIGLVLASDDSYKFSHVFVSIGFLAVIVGAALGMAVFGPGSRSLAASLRAGRADDARKMNTRLAAFGVLDTLVVLVAIVAMVGKWGV